MVRLLLFLPVCLILQDRQCRDCAEPVGDAGPLVALKTEYLPATNLPGQEFVAGLSAAPLVPFPANIPWEPLREISLRRQQAIENLLRQDPPRFLQMCVERYDREVRGYSCILQKRERVYNRLLPTEVVEAHF